MMGPRVPVEIWQKILRHAMHIPVFFDIDPIETYCIQAMPYFGDEEPYWETERVKNVLKRKPISSDILRKRRTCDPQRQSYNLRYVTTMSIDANDLNNTLNLDMSNLRHLVLRNSCSSGRFKLVQRLQVIWRAASNFTLDRNPDVARIGAEYLGTLPSRRGASDPL
ncbi:hypothetical protein PIIN_11146 [Serendipita indica DSM 11827]|uniref:Uncharacterized protein n=1 Tax=Serendipita indica (strain DSM 11827) TaxID=1109443 RepID=G4U0S1_SERID|nr:hypothetical protein PIIN_11146 [Serendipita indica DSM 11827]